MLLHRLNIIADDDSFSLAEALVSVNCPGGWEEESLPTGDHLLKVTSESMDELRALHDELNRFVPGSRMEFVELPDVDWQENWRAFFTSVDAGCFRIVPPWLASVPEGDGEETCRIIIEPRSAFGTGHHPTTVMCLEAMTRLMRSGTLRPGMDFADVGTGSGILSIACAKMKLHGVGVDIDPLSISNAKENALLNGTEGVTFLEGSTEALAGRQFDLVIANILAGPLVEMAVPLMSLMRTGGCLILSGFLQCQLPALMKAYAPLGAPVQIASPSAAADPTKEGDPEQDNWICLFWGMTGK